MNPSTSEPWDKWTLRQLNPPTNEPFDKWTLGRVKPWTSEPSDKWTLRQVNPRTSEPSDKWNHGQVNTHTGEPSDKWTLDKWTLRQVNPQTTGWILASTDLSYACTEFCLIGCVCVCTYCGVSCAELTDVAVRGVVRLLTLTLGRYRDRKSRRAVHSVIVQLATLRAQPTCQTLVTVLAEFAAQQIKLSPW